MTPGKAQQLVSLFKAGDRKGTEKLVAEQRRPSSVFDWCITQGMHITGTTTPWDFLTAINEHSLVDMTQYRGLPHLPLPVVTDMDKAVAALRWTVIARG